MSDSSETAEARAARTSERLRGQGFEAGQPVNEFYDCFTLADAQRSLFESTYDTPIPVYLADERDMVRLPVVITKAERRHSPSDTGAGCFKYPDWLFEGWIIPSGYDPVPSIQRVRIFVGQLHKDELSQEFLWQRIPDNPDPTGLIVHTEL